MIKGARKQMIVVRTGESRYFDEAYFVLRRDIDSNGKETNDMLSEANRIIKESETSPSSRRRKIPRTVLFLAGLIAGAVIMALVWWLV